MIISMVKKKKVVWQAESWRQRIQDEELPQSEAAGVVIIGMLLALARVI